MSKGIYRYDELSSLKQEYVFIKRDVFTFLKLDDELEKKEEALKLFEYYDKHFYWNNEYSYGICNEIKVLISDAIEMFEGLKSEKEFFYSAHPSKVGNYSYTTYNLNIIYTKKPYEVIWISTETLQNKASQLKSFLDEGIIPDERKELDVLFDLKIAIEIVEEILNQKSKIVMETECVKATIRDIMYLFPDFSDINFEAYKEEELGQCFLDEVKFKQKTITPSKK